MAMERTNKADCKKGEGDASMIKEGRRGEE
jgi:hypothetical protein